MSYFECEYCLKKFVRESYYKKHSCEEMKRVAILKKPIGMQSYASYCEWLVCKGYKVHNQDQFMDSRLFNPFVLFTQFSRKMAIPAKDKYIAFMAEKDIHPRDWTKTFVYDHYINNIDSIMTPEEQFDVSVDTIHELKRTFECDAGEVFLFMDADTVIRIVQAKKLLPWFILQSKKFAKFMQDEMSREQRILLEQLIGVDKWKEKFSKLPNKTAKFKRRVKEMGL